MDLLAKLKTVQVKPKLLDCTASSNCWCAKLKFTVPYSVGYDRCMTPKELLYEFGSKLDKDDKQYLQSLEHKECTW